MSRARGIVPLLLATALGVGNGIWVFGPAFREEREHKEAAAHKLPEVSDGEFINEQQEKPKAVIGIDPNDRKDASEDVKPKVESKLGSWWSNMPSWSDTGNRRGES